MTAIPSTVALETIADGSPRRASPMRNNFAALQTAVNGLIGVAGDSIAQTYTPAWTCASGGDPSLGNGTVAGTYVQVGDLVQLHVELSVGSTTTFGGGAYRFSIPSGAVSGAANGTVFGYDSSASAAYIGLCRNDTATTFIVYVGAGAATAWAAGNPFTWATNDILSLDVAYLLA